MAATRYRESLALADRLGMRPLIAHCHAGLAKLWRRTGKPADANEHFRAAAALYREMGMTYWLEKANAEASQYLTRAWIAQSKVPAGDFNRDRVPFGHHACLGSSEASRSMARLR